MLTGLLMLIGRVLMLTGGLMLKKSSCGLLTALLTRGRGPPSPRWTKEGVAAAVARGRGAGGGARACPAL